MFTVDAVAPPRRKRALRGRHLVVIDLENLIGGPVVTAGQTAQARLAVGQALELHGYEHIVLGTSHAGRLAAILGWQGSRTVARSGLDGADLALLDVLTSERVSERFDEVSLVSGDGIFTEAVAALGSAGVAVTVLSRREACSNRLRMAAGRTILLDSPVANMGGAA